MFFSHHLVARVYESKAEFRSALQHEKEGYTIYKNQVGPAEVHTLAFTPPVEASVLILRIFPSSQMGEAHEKTKESSDYLKYLTQQAVALQRTMNEIYKNGSNASIMPLKVSALTATLSLRGWRKSVLLKPPCRPVFPVHRSQHGQHPGTAQHHQRHHLYSTQVKSEKTSRDHEEVCVLGRNEGEIKHLKRAWRSG